MSSFHIIEFFIVLAIVFFQFKIFNSTKHKIKEFGDIFPEYTNFFINKVALLPEYWEKSPRDILAKLSEFIQKSKPKRLTHTDIYGEKLEMLQDEEDKRVINDLLACKNSPSENTVKILNHINTYLIRNKGIVADFHLIKDIVERNVDAKEDEIAQTVSTPLYLGLIGTFLGIIMGLLQIFGSDFSADSGVLDNAISTLLGGVMIAMMASLCGLSFTVYNNAILFKNAKLNVLENKNEFYTFIQTELLPLLNQNMSSTLYSLQNNLHKFNEKLEININSLIKVLGKNEKNIKSQQQIFESLKDIDIAEFAKANVIILSELKHSVEKFQNFNQYLDQTNDMLVEARGFTRSVNEMISRTDNFNQLGIQIVNSFNNNEKIIMFLQNHYNNLEQSSQLMNMSVSKAHSILESSLDQMKIFTLDKINEIHNLVNSEMDKINAEYPEKWKKLDKLELLENLNKGINSLDKSNNSQIEKLYLSMEKVNDNLVNITKQDTLYSDLKKEFSKAITWFKSSRRNDVNSNLPRNGKK